MLGKVGPGRAPELEDACGRFHTLLHSRLPMREVIMSGWRRGLRAPDGGRPRSEGAKERTLLFFSVFEVKRRDTDRRQREGRQTHRRTDRQEAERAILTVIEVFIWIKGDLDA